MSWGLRPPAGKAIQDEVGEKRASVGWSARAVADAHKVDANVCDALDSDRGGGTPCECPCRLRRFGSKRRRAARCLWTAWWLRLSGWLGRRRSRSARHRTRRFERSHRQSGQSQRRARPAWWRSRPTCHRTHRPRQSQWHARPAGRRASGAARSGEFRRSRPTCHRTSRSQRPSRCGWQSHRCAVHRRPWPVPAPWALIAPGATGWQSPEPSGTRLRPRRRAERDRGRSERHPLVVDRAHRRRGSGRPAGRAGLWRTIIVRAGSAPILLQPATGWRRFPDPRWSVDHQRIWRGWRAGVNDWRVGLAVRVLRTSCRRSERQAHRVGASAWVRRTRRARLCRERVLFLRGARFESGHAASSHVLGASADRHGPRGRTGAWAAGSRAPVAAAGWRAPNWGHERPAGSPRAGHGRATARVG